VPLRERVQLGAFEVECADAAVLDQQRHNQLRPGIGNGIDVARVLRYVGRQHHFLVLHGVAEQPLAHLHGAGVRALAVADRHLELDHLRGVVDQRDAEGAIGDEPLHQVRHSGQQFVEVEDGAHLAADVGQRFHRLGVFALGFEQPGVGQRLGDRGGEHPQNLLVVLVEGVQLVAEQVERAEHLVLVA
jgi:hypothetical protein